MVLCTTQILLQIRKEARLRPAVLDREHACRKASAEVAAVLLDCPMATMTESLAIATEMASGC